MDSLDQDRGDVVTSVPRVGWCYERRWKCYYGSTTTNKRHGLELRPALPAQALDLGIIVETLTGLRAWLAGGSTMSAIPFFDKSLESSRGHTKPVFLSLQEEPAWPTPLHLSYETNTDHSIVDHLVLLLNPRCRSSVAEPPRVPPAPTRSGVATSTAPTCRSVTLIITPPRSGVTAC